jgi:golgi to ER traffic protein 4
LAGGAKLLLDAGQGGSGGDLCLFLMEVYHKAEVGLDDEAAKGEIYSWVCLEKWGVM